MDKETLKRLIFFCAVSSACCDAFGQGAIDVVTKHVNYTLDSTSPQAVAVLKEASVVIGGDRALQLRIEAEPSRGPVRDALIGCVLRVPGWFQNDLKLTMCRLVKSAKLVT